ncbi:hypothetical protein [Sphingobium lignivorans]|uniref:Uncharacterized protein n=1 Tax=Sphingobium lignivorans TaxID=2735886 RepID=A0ABR6NG33_9SPHN|nr:hypothetical protein [Sphingobium lignivorans]MBB5986245.1 hypothetical protein [Sphingobium lignivorans]
MTVRDDILGMLESGEAPRPPQSYAVGGIEMAAIGIFENSARLVAWMQEMGLDPHQGPDAVLGLGLLLVRDARAFPRPTPVVDADFEWPDDHH